MSEGPGRGGKRSGSGRKAVVGGRQFMRDIADSAEFRESFRAAVGAELAAGKTDSFLRAFEAGYGRPPQALDVRTAQVQPGEQLVYAAAFADGDPVGEAVEAAPAPDLPAGAGI